MDELTIHFHGFLYLVTLDENGLPTIHAQGRPAEIPEGAYAEAILHPQINFACDRCGQAVRSAFPGFHAQLCRCFLVKHHCLDRSFTSVEEWTAFRETYERESLNPAPDNPMVFDPISKKPIKATNKAVNFMARKIGFKRPIKISQAGALIKTSEGGSVYTDPEAKTCSLQIESETEIEDAYRAFKLKTGGGPPPFLIIVGDDPDYVFPTETYDIKPRPFCCPNCNVRVKEGRLDYPGIDRIACCLCLSVYFRADIPSPRSSGDWREFRRRGLEGHVKHRAAAADGNS